MQPWCKGRDPHGHSNPRKPRAAAADAARQVGERVLQLHPAPQRSPPRPSANPEAFWAAELRNTTAPSASCDIRRPSDTHLRGTWHLHAKSCSASSLPAPWISREREQSSYRREKRCPHHHTLPGSAAELLEQEVDNTHGVYLTQLTLSTLSKQPASTSILWRRQAWSVRSNFPTPNEGLERSVH